MLVGIDVGTQSLKAVVLDEGLKLRAAAATSYQPAFPRPGWAEQDPGLWEAALAPTIAKALDQAGARAADVRALGIAGQLDGCIATDSNGRPHHPCLIWMDRRAEAEIAGLPAAEIEARTGVFLDASHMAAKIRWLKAHAEILGPGTMFHQPTSYLVARLTGRHVMDHGLASTSLLYGLAARRYDPWLLERFEIGPSELPALDEASAPAGSLTAAGAQMTGLPPGTLVAVGTGDDFSTPLGAGVVEPGRVVCVLGTAEVVGAVHSKPAIDRGRLVETHAYVGDRFFIENPGWLSGGALAWFKTTFRLESFEELDALAEAVPPGAAGLTFLPALSGSMAPEWIASARGCFYGLTPAHGTGHMARAVLEGTAFALRDVVERLEAMGVEARALLLLGGGAKSRTWAAIRADLTGLPVEIPTVSDTAPIGSALLAAVAAGLQPDLMTAARQIGEIEQVIEPNDGTRPAYDAAYARYHRLFNSLKPLY